MTAQAISLANVPFQLVVSTSETTVIQNFLFQNISELTPGGKSLLPLQQLGC